MLLRESNPALTAEIHTNIINGVITEQIRAELAKLDVANIERGDLNVRMFNEQLNSYF